jgi:prepilin-type processing-associated H-X9-DG protein
MVAQYPHEWIFMWLSTVLSGFVQNRQLGKVLGSRTAVKISENDGMSVVANGCQVVTNCTGMTGEKGFLRHFGGAHYAFVDGHIKWYRPEQVNDNQGGNTNPKPFDGSYPSFQVQ